jgi:hypothetical protein
MILSMSTIGGGILISVHTGGGGFGCGATSDINQSDHSAISDSMG